MAEAFAVVAAALVSAAAAGMQESRNRSQQRSLARRQEEQANKQIALEGEANAKQNAKKADISGLLDSNSVGNTDTATQLNGAQGSVIDDSLLGRNNPLGS